MQNLVFIGVIIQAIGISAYIRDMFRGKTKPNRITWIGWSIAPLIAAAAAISGGAGWAALPTFMVGFLPLIIFILSFFVKGAYWKLSSFDYFCGLFSILAIVLWSITNNPIVAVILSILADICAALPTLYKIWHHPETETPITYILGIIAVATTFAAVSTYDFVTLGFAIYVIIANTIITSLILFRRK